SLLGTLVLSAAVTLGVLTRPQTAWWLSTRPGPRLFLQALRTALVVLFAIVAAAAVISYTALLFQDDEVELEGVLLLLTVLPNLGLLGLNLAWGATIRAEASASDGGLSDYVSLDLSQLGDEVGEHGDLAIAGALCCG